MLNIGDVVSYDKYVGVVTDADNLTLALHTGETVKVPVTAEVILLVSYKEILSNFERSILHATGNLRNR